MGGRLAAFMGSAVIPTVYHALTSKLAWGCVSILRSLTTATYLVKVGRYDRTIGKLPASKLFKCRLRAFGALIFKEDLAHAGTLPTATRWARDLEFQDRAVFGAFLLDVFADF